MKGRQKLLALAKKLRTETGASCIYINKRGKTEVFTLGYTVLFGKRFLLIKYRNRLPIALIKA